MVHYSQFKAYKALTLASLKSILKSPSSVIFTIAFPLIFIIAFGWIDSKEGFQKINIGLIVNDPAINLQLESKNYWNIYSFNTEDDIEKVMIEKKLDAVIVQKSDNQFNIISSNDNDNDDEYIYMLRDLLQSQLSFTDDSSSLKKFILTSTTTSPSISKKIDYILPGQLGFSLLAASVFGTAFVFFGLRNGNVLKRFFATPIKSITLLLAEGSSRLFFQLLGAILLILIGYYFFDFSLPSHLWTIAGIIILSIFSIISFMSFGFIISGIAKSESTVPPLANIIVLPQFILSDTFIPVKDLPEIIGKISHILPLTHFNQAVRLFAQHEISELPWMDISVHMAVIITWGITGYLIATKTFKWE